MFEYFVCQNFVRRGDGSHGSDLPQIDLLMLRESKVGGQCYHPQMNKRKQLYQAVVEFVLFLQNNLDGSDLKGKNSNTDSMLLILHVVTVYVFLTENVVDVIVGRIHQQTLCLVDHLALMRADLACPHHHCQNTLPSECLKLRLQIWERFVE
jgi:hypothetical protein